MKKTLLLALTLVSTSAFAKIAPTPPRLTCAQGVIGEDTFQQVVYVDGKISIDLHETNITIENQSILEDGPSKAILNKDATQWAEGEESRVRVDALFVWNPADNTLNATVLVDGVAVMNSATLTCSGPYPVGN